MDEVLEGSRQLNEAIPSYTATKATTWSDVNGWFTHGTYDFVAYETYFDLSGFTRNHMTCFPTGATIQDPGRYTCTNPLLQFEVLDIISEVRLATPSLSQLVQNHNSMPGMNAPLSIEDWTQLQWGQYRMMLPQATFAGHQTIFLTANGGLFGSGEPTTSDKLWVYRFVQMIGADDGDTIEIPASRIVLNAMFSKEGDKEFLMRQKRSYELQGSVI